MIPELFAVLLDILLAAIDDPAFILDQYGVLQIANNAGLGFCAAGFATGAAVGKQMPIADEAAARLIQRVAATAYGPDSAEITIRHHANKSMRLSVAVIPNPFTGTEARESAELTQPVLITVRSMLRSHDLDTLSARFGLTPAETRVLEKCLEGLTIAEAAASLGRSRRTVDNQLRAIYQKCGVRRLVELVLLTADVSEPPGQGRAN